MKSTYQLSPEEFGVLSDYQFMPLKQKVWAKLEGILAILAEKKRVVVEEFEKKLELNLSQSSPKISKGENYHSFPYRVLDYPRVVDIKDMFLFRTMILWGHPIGFHLILSGKNQEAFAEKLLSEQHRLPFDINYAQQDTPWIWEDTADGFIPLSDGSKINPRERGFFKLSSFIPLSDYQKIPSYGEEILAAYLEVIF